MEIFEGIKNQSKKSKKVKGRREYNGGGVERGWLLFSTLKSSPGAQGIRGHVHHPS